MVARLKRLLAMSPAAMLLVATVGDERICFARLSGIAQNDIKKVPCTIDGRQLGLNVRGGRRRCVFGGVFHLMTHACSSVPVPQAPDRSPGDGGERKGKMGGCAIRCHHFPDLPATRTLRLPGCLRSRVSCQGRDIWQAFAKAHGSMGGVWIADGITVLSSSARSRLDPFRRVAVTPRAGAHLHESPFYRWPVVSFCCGAWRAVGVRSLPIIPESSPVQKTIRRAFLIRSSASRLRAQ